MTTTRARAGSATAISSASLTIAAVALLVAGVNGPSAGLVRPGVVLAPSVRWNKLAPDHRSINTLTSDRLTDIGGGPTFYSCLVEVEKCGD